MACGKCNRNKIKNKQSSRMPIKEDIIDTKRGVEIPVGMTPNQRRVVMNKVMNSPNTQNFYKRQSVEEYQKRIQESLAELAKRKK